MISDHTGNWKRFPRKMSTNVTYIINMAADDLPRDQHFNGLVQERCKSSVLAMELCLYRTKPSIKGSNMIVCVLIFGVKLLRVLSRHAVWSRGRSLSDCPTARQHLRQGSELPPPLVTKMHVLVFYGRLGVWNRTAPDRRHLLPLATTKFIMQCV